MSDRDWDQGLHDDRPASTMEAQGDREQPAHCRIDAMYIPSPTSASHGQSSGMHHSGSAAERLPDVRDSNRYQRLISRTLSANVASRSNTGSNVICAIWA